MTQEEYEQQQAEIERLVNQINALIDENNRMIEEINLALSNIQILNQNVVVLHDNIEPYYRRVSGEVIENSEQTDTVRKAIEEMTTQYFTFKTLSTASKNLTQYTDEYHTRFSYYNNLRRVTLGYVVGLDAQFVTREKMRSMVETAYLQNTQYWLAYATMAVMLWASDEPEAAGRALDKALFIAPQKAALYFMLINLRFGRNQVAQEWFIYYMDRVNAMDLGEEWQFLLQAYLLGVFGPNEAFHQEVSKRFRTLIAQAEATTVDFSKKFVDRSYQSADTWLHVTREGFAYLKESCADYPEMQSMLSNAEKYSLIAASYGAILEEKETAGETIAQRVENVLYSLVNSYDPDELEVYKKIRYNEAVMAAQGDVSAAQRKYDAEFGTGEQKTFADLMMDWAFAEESTLTPLCVRKFSISFMKDWMIKGYQKYAEQNHNKEKKDYNFVVDGCEVTCSEDNFEQGKAKIESFYSKNEWKKILSDKFTLIYILITAAGLLTLGIMAVQLAGGHFSRVALVIGILLVLLGVFLFWRQIVALKEKLKEQKRLSIQKLQHCLEELGQWRQKFHMEEERMADLEEALNQFASH